MSSVAAAFAPGRIRSLDTWAVPALLVALMLTQLAATRSFSLLQHRLWLDEYHTKLLVDDPSLPHAYQALKHGVDTNAPALYLIVRAVVWCAGSSDVGVLRGVALVSVSLAVLGIYAMVRPVYGPMVALVAAVATWSHPLVVRHAFEIRFYGPWLAACVGFAWALRLSSQPGGSRLGRAILLAGSAMLLCTIHYFGVIALGLMALGHLVVGRSDFRARVFELLPAGAGLVALAACLPFYFGQKASLTVPTWIEPPTLTGVRTFLGDVFGIYIFAIPVLALFLTQLFRTGEPTEDGTTGEGQLATLAPLVALGALPFVLVVLSYVMQSFLIDRYAIPAVACFGPLLAPVVARLGKPGRWAVLVCFLLVSTVNLMSSARWYRMYDGIRDEKVAELSTCGDGPILVQGRWELYELWYDAPQLRDRLFLWDPADKGSDAARMFVFEKAMAANHERWYGLGKANSLAKLEDQPIVYLYGVEPRDVLALERSDPSLQVQPLNQKRGLYEVRRQGRFARRTPSASAATSGM
jgi:hypothetical protein